ncbi:MAG: hypothetical protein WDN46_10750 [Methylocella sp.]
MASDEKVKAYYRDPAAGTSELVHMDPFDYRDAKKKWPDQWSLDPFVGLKQITAHRHFGEVYGYAEQAEPGGAYILKHADGRAQQIDPRTGAAVGPKVAAPIPPIAAEAPRRDSEGVRPGKATGARPSISNWDTFIGPEDGFAN